MIIMLWHNSQATHPYSLPPMLLVGDTDRDAPMFQFQFRSVLVPPVPLALAPGRNDVLTQGKRPFALCHCRLESHKKRGQVWGMNFVGGVGRCRRPAVRENSELGEKRNPWLGIGDERAGFKWRNGKHDRLERTTTFLVFAAACGRGREGAPG